MSDDPAALRRKYGKYLPHQRANVDQVPLPIVNVLHVRRGRRLRTPPDAMHVP